MNTLLHTWGGVRMKGKIIQDVIKVRDTGRTNMFDVYAVQRVAYELELYELVIFLEEKKNWKEYTRFILTGK